MVTRRFRPHEVLCNYNGKLVSHKEGKAAYKATPPDAMGYMFQFKHQGTSMWLDSTEEQPQPGRLINHSKCHANVSTGNSYELHIYHLDTIHTIYIIVRYNKCNFIVYFFRHATNGSTCYFFAQNL